MQTSAKDENKLRHQMAVRQASIGKGSAFFNLLFPFCIVTTFLFLYVIPLLFMQFLQIQSEQLRTYLTWSPPVISIAACALYGYLRHKRLKPVIERLRSELKNTQHSP
ncbi:MAG: hypothetical protein KKD00_04235 [Gammaproteobacteria bacterium]|nr:hypothetical protein [Gammaproteobacteria bacterium]